MSPKATILIVDDEPDVVKVVTMSFNLQKPDWLIRSAREATPRSLPKTQPRREHLPPSILWTWRCST